MGTEEEVFEEWWKKFEKNHPFNIINPRHVREIAWAAWLERAKWKPA